MPTRIAVGASMLVTILSLFGCGSGADSDADYAERMAVEHAGDRPVASELAASAARSELDERDVNYATVDGAPVRGFLAQPAGGVARSGVIVIQEWWGLNENIRSMARRIAGEGYLALAVDLYTGQVAESPDQARELMTAAMQREASLEENLRQAYRYLEEQGAERIGVIGWCFGGGWSLRTALLLPDEVDATVIYYGRLITERDRLATLEMPVLGLFGSEDGGIPLESVREFESVLAELGKDASIQVYEGANHAFANPSGTRYDAAAAEDAWAKTLAFYAEHLRVE